MTPDEIRRLAAYAMRTRDYPPVAETLRALAEVVEVAQDAPPYGPLIVALTKLEQINP